LQAPQRWARAEAAERRSGFAFRHLDRAVQGLYPPGSVFKAVTAAAVLDLGLHRVDSEDFDYRSEHEERDKRGLPIGWHELRLRDGPPIYDGNHPHVADWRFNLEEAFAYSDNVAFAQMGLQLGPVDLVDYARRFGFERPLRVQGLGSATSTLDGAPAVRPDSRFLARSDSNLARTAFGQAQVTATPLQMALVPAAIANGGVIMRPQVVAGFRSAGGAWIHRYEPQVLRDTRLAATTLAGMRQIMHASVTYGLARTARLNPRNAAPGVAGKTGSAEWSDDPDSTHSWFIGYFPAEAPRLALAVVVERGGPGPRVAARIAKHVFGSPPLTAYLSRVGVR
jgi:penicillin-binding protein A